MTRVMGLDLSTRSSGVAGPVPGTVRTIAPVTKEPGRRLEEITRRLDAYVRLGVDVAVIEVPVVGRGGVDTMRVLAEVHGAVKVGLFQRDVAVAEVKGSTLKKFATGNGAASKDDMVAAAGGCEVDVGNDDEADAFWLQAMGRMVFDGVEPLYLREQLRERRFEALGVVKWPRLTVATGR